MRARAVPALLLAVLVGLGLLGCAQNSVLEMEIWLPSTDVAGPGGPAYRYALTHVRPLEVSDCGNEGEVRSELGIEWGGTFPSPVQLEAEERVDCTSVVSDRELECVGVKVHFCQSVNCVDDDLMRVPQAWFALQHPFYVGRRTRFRTARSTTAIDGTFVPSPLHGYLDSPTPPADPAFFEIGRCGIVGCIGGTPANGCDAAGRHFCETNDNHDLPPDDGCNN